MVVSAFVAVEDAIRRKQTINTVIKYEEVMLTRDALLQLMATTTTHYKRQSGNLQLSGRCTSAAGRKDKEGGK